MMPTVLGSTKRGGRDSMNESPGGIFERLRGGGETAAEEGEGGTEEDTTDRMSTK